ncbi:MAG: AAA family ATPase [Candidatus Thorarchaeota archaeon]
MATTTKNRKSNPTVKEKNPLPYMKAGETNLPPAELLDYCVLIFGEKGIGKTTLCASIPNSYVNQYEVRRRNLKIRQTSIGPQSVSDMNKSKAKATKDSKYLTPWQKIVHYHSLQIEDDSVECIIEDTVDKAWEACTNHICFMKGIEYPGDIKDYGKTWTKIKEDFLSEYSRILEAEKGLFFISHAKFKEIELRGSEVEEVLVPTCVTGAFEFLKGACDFAFYYGYTEERRTMTLRGGDDVWCACGSDEFFLDTAGTKLKKIEMGDTPAKSYEILQNAFLNKVTAPEKKRRRRNSNGKD